MKKHDVFGLAGNPEFIPGIYNYCDRWCERCAFTQRCLTFATEQADKQADGDQDAGNDQFWQKLEASLQLTREMLKDFAEEQGVIVDPKEGKAHQDAATRRRRQTERHPLAMAARAYAQDVDRWFKDEKQLLMDKEAEVTAKVELGLPGVREEITGLTEVVEVIRWYQHLIYVKLMRGLRHDDESMLDEIQSKDAEGSAKVALIAIDRSIAAWSHMRESFPANTDEILTHLVKLDRLRRSTEAAFPNARAFVRPGFDTEGR